MAPTVMYRVIYGLPNPPEAFTRRYTFAPAIVEGYCRRRVLDRQYPGITAEEDNTVLGTYVTGLTKMDMVRLDHFEGSEYRKRVVKAQVLDHEGKVQRTEEATTYVFLNPGGLEDAEWDFEHFKKENMHRWSGEEAFTG